MSFGSRLKERREALHLKQSDLGRRLNITGSAVGNYENGVSFPKADILYKVFDILECDANYLFQDEMGIADPLPSLVPDEEKLLSAFRSLNADGKKAAMAAVDGIAASPAFQQDTLSSGMA